MNDWFSDISKISALSAKAIQNLNEIGFIAIPDAVKPDDLPLLTAAYDKAVCSASPNDKRSSRPITRVTDFVDRRESIFDLLYFYLPLL